MQLHWVTYSFITMNMVSVVPGVSRSVSSAVIGYQIILYFIREQEK